MHESYEREQERLINAAGQVVQTAASVGVQLWMARHKPLKIHVRTAADDVRDVRQGIEQGKSEEELLHSLKNNETYQRIAQKSQKDADKYAQSISRRSEIEHAINLMPPTQSLSQQKTPKKSL